MRTLGVPAAGGAATALLKAVRFAVPERSISGNSAALTARKFGYFWAFSPQSGLLYPLPWLTGYQIYYGVVTLFAAVGIGAILFSRSARQRQLLLTLAVIAVTLAAIHALSYVEGRHRWGVEPLLLLLTARGAVAVFDAIGVFALHRPITRLSGRPRTL